MTRKGAAPPIGAPVSLHGVTSGYKLLAHDEETGMSWVRGIKYGEHLTVDTSKLRVVPYAKG